VNTRQQGAIGVARAAAFYANKGFAVFVPVSDMTRYDLVVDTGERLLRVEVKTTREKNGEVHLATDGGNRSWSGEVKALSATDCDLVFIVNLNTGTEREFVASELDGRKTIRVNHQVLDLDVPA
jgi:hypothetical protein